MDRDTIGQVPGCRSSGIRRRTILAGMAGLLGGCVAPNPDLEPPREPPEIAYYRAIYAARVDGRVSIPAVDPRRIDPRYLRQVVQHSGPESPGTVVVDPDKRFLHLVLESGEALRYGVGVGREGFGWNGSARIGRKAEWPTWTPPKEMIERQPETAEWASGMPGGLDNPLGARALYLYQDGRDTLYRIHGTNEPWSIGHAVSSGCIRLLNQDVIDLYRRVPVGSRVVVRPSSGDQTV